MSWRMEKPCANCPFRGDDAAIHLSPKRLAGIKNAVLLGQPFHCHKTVHADATEWIVDEDGFEQPQKGEHWRECAGALDYRTETYRTDPGAIERAFRAVLSGEETD